MRFVANEDNLTIELKGWERLWALKMRLVLPRSEIENLEWTPEFFDRDRALRLGGTGASKWLYAGRFRVVKTHEWLFLYLRRPKGFTAIGGFGAKNALIVTMKSGKYKQIIVNCQPDIGASLVAWWRG
ncbi:MAG: hypothetical protein ACREGA_04945 [Candidatus Saccharimonadales bacterium]